MGPQEQLHRTLSAAAQLLDDAASRVMDVKLEPTKQHLRHIGEALALVFQVQRAVEVANPKLAKQYKPPTEESSANRRLGDALVEAEGLAESKGNAEAQAFLERFATSEPSVFHRDLALLQATRYRLRDGTSQETPSK
jgi:hypothetical protein